MSIDFGDLVIWTRRRWHDGTISWGARKHSFPPHVNPTVVFMAPADTDHGDLYALAREELGLAPLGGEARPPVGIVDETRGMLR